MTKFLQKQYGFSLVEIMIANLLGIILLLALTQIYLNIKTTYSLQHALVTIQEHGRFVTYLLNQKIRMAGFANCENHGEPMVIADAIHGYGSSNAPNFLPRNRLIPGTDIITIKRCDLINNQEKLVTIAFYIADTLQKNHIGQPVYGLYQKVFFDKIQNNTQELASGVENMQLEFGISEDANNVTSYKNVAQMTTQDWEKVKSLQIALLINSLDNVLKKPEPYYFKQQLIVANDRMLHKEWNTYIALRERY